MAHSCGDALFKAERALLVRGGPNGEAVWRGGFEGGQRGDEHEAAADYETTQPAGVRIEQVMIGHSDLLS